MRPEDRTRLGDLVVMDFVEGECHLLIDGVVTTVYRNSALTKAAAIPRFAARQVDNRKFNADQVSLNPVSINHGGR